MIDHYSLYEINALTDRFRLTNGVPKGVRPRYNICPTQNVPVVILGNDGSTELSRMQWGLVSSGAKDANSVFRYKTFNVKSEKVFSKPSWDVAVRKQRCLIPMNGFYMIRSGEGNDAYYFTSAEQSVMTAAGIYTTWTDPSGVDRQTFAMLTIESNDAMPLPFGRMPVLVHTADERAWADQSVQDFSALVTMMRPFEGPALKYRKVSSDVSSTKIDTPALVESKRYDD
jgi:putative SOS response-associated peptidase YedK